MKPKTAVAISTPSNRISRTLMIIIVSTSMLAASCSASRGGYGCPSQNIPAAKASYRAR